jgi:hypothetical protein
MNPINLEYAEEALAEVSDLLHWMGFPYSVYSGQLLSLYRQHAVVPHDNDTDLDFAVLLPRYGDLSWWVEELRERFAEAGYTDSYKRGADRAEAGGFRPNQECFEKNGCLIDIAIYQPAVDGESMFCIVDTGKKVHPLRLFIDRQPFLFKGKYYPMLWPAVEYCERTWGDSWRTPKTSKDVSWVEECICITPDREWM